MTRGRRLLAAALLLHLAIAEAGTLADAVWRIDDANDADVASVRRLVDDGADPDAGGREGSALYAAIATRKPRVARLLFARTRSVASVGTFDIVNLVDPPSLASELLRDHARAAGHTDDHAIEFAVQQAQWELLRGLAAARVPVVEERRYWLDGRETTFLPGLYRQLRGLPDAALFRSVAALPLRLQPPEGERGPADWVEFDRGESRLLVTTNAANPRAAHVVELGVSLCVHVWRGADCGPRELRERARRWMDALPAGCGTALCKLSAEAARPEPRYQMAVCPVGRDECQGVDSPDALARRE